MSCSERLADMCGFYMPVLGILLAMGERVAVDSGQDAQLRLLHLACE